MNIQPSSNVVAMPRKKKSRKPSTRVRGQGSLIRRGDIFWMELNWQGVRYRRSLETTDRETALIKLDAEVAAIRAGEMPKKFEPIRVQEMFDAFIVRAKVDCKPRTVRDYKSRWESHLKAEFGNLIATQVTKDKVTAYLHMRMTEGASLCTRNREQRILMMVFNYNQSKIPADRRPEFPKMQSEKSHIHTGRLSKEDYETFRARLDKPDLFWLKVLVTMAFKWGFRRSELLNAKAGYFDAKASTFTLPSYTTKNKQARVVTLVPDGEIFKMLVALTAGRDANAALFIRNGVPVRDYRNEWIKQTAGIKGGSGKNGAVTLHDLRRSAITEMNNKNINAAQAGTHLTVDVFYRYVSPSDAERRAIAAKVEGD